MGVVRILPDKLANQIAAGEVVERPVSALKELVENALDAGASRISVEIEAGGKKRIRVEDNGVGMDREDCLMALERHATSKLTRSEDLFSIKTLGFRGEALPSIASVSRFTLESRHREAECGVKVTVHGSTLKDVRDIQKQPGTTVTVDNLFFNIPARRKFLRTTETELSWIVTLMTTFSFAHVDKDFSLFHNGKPLFQVSAVKTLKERIYQHYGRRLLDDLIPFDCQEGGFHIRGLLSKPHVRKSNRNYQFLFVNGRLVRDKVLNHAIFDAYREFGESKQYPVIFLFISCDSTEVDVNVHPAKTEIKFIHSNQVHGLVSDTLKQALTSIPQTTPWRQAKPLVEGRAEADQPQEVQEHIPLDRPPVTYSESTPYAKFLREKEAFFGEPAEGSTQAFASRPIDSPSQETTSMQATSPERVSEAPAVEGQTSGLKIPRIIGQYKESFILAEDDDALLLIDQHVAHERILYDQIYESFTSGSIETQLLLIPQTIELTPAQIIRLEEAMELLGTFGFDLDRFDGNTFVIREVPAFLPEGDLQRMVIELVDKAQGEMGETAVEQMIQHMAATRACKAAVKINMRLTHEKMLHLVEELYRSNTPLFCPHGRPVVLRMTDLDIEKNFLRR